MLFEHDTNISDVLVHVSNSFYLSFLKTPCARPLKIDHSLYLSKEIHFCQLKYKVQQIVTSSKAFPLGFKATSFTFSISLTCSLKLKLSQPEVYSSICTVGPFRTCASDFFLGVLEQWNTCVNHVMKSNGVKHLRDTVYSTVRGGLEASEDVTWVRLPPCSPQCRESDIGQLMFFMPHREVAPSAPPLPPSHRWGDPAELCQLTWHEGAEREQRRRQRGGGGGYSTLLQLAGKRTVDPQHRAPSSSCTSSLCLCLLPFAPVPPLRFFGSLQLSHSVTTAKPALLLYCMCTHNTLYIQHQDLLTASFCLRFWLCWRQMGWGLSTSCVNVWWRTKWSCYCLILFTPKEQRMRQNLNGNNNHISPLIPQLLWLSVSCFYSHWPFFVLWPPLTHPPPTHIDISYSCPTNTKIPLTVSPSESTIEPLLTAAETNRRPQRPPCPGG